MIGFILFFIFLPMIVCIGSVMIVAVLTVFEKVFKFVFGVK